MPPKSKEPGSPSKKLNANPEDGGTHLFLHGEADCLGGTSFEEASFTAALSHIKNLHTEGAVRTQVYVIYLFLITQSF